MTRFLLSMLCILSFMSCETQAIVRYCHETAEEDREQARLELEALQAECPSAVVGQMLETTRVDDNHYETRVCMTIDMPESDIKRLYAILKQVRPNPRYVRSTGGCVIPPYRVSYSNRFLLTIQGQERELIWQHIREDNRYGEPKWLLDKTLISEYRSLMFKYTPKRPKNKR